MTATKLKVYYLEDNFDELENLRENYTDALILPTSKSAWSQDITAFQDFVSKDIEIRKGLVTDLQSRLLEQKVDMFFLDYFLEKNSGPSTTVYKEVILTHKDLRNTPVIFLTVHTNQDDLPLSSICGYVQKELDEDEESVKKFIGRLREEVAKFSSWIESSSSSVTHSPDPTFSNWLRINF
ncbi:hypothetical protein ACEN2P_03200 [Pedobacter psychrotolerans]|uniref:hypothetical protein n=1 Tax=Pedobacter psychrotolerans TaxID=1843235 RepID=UPI003F965A02